MGLDGGEGLDSTSMDCNSRIKPLCLQLNGRISAFTGSNQTAPQMLMLVDYFIVVYNSPLIVLPAIMWLTFVVLGEMSQPLIGR